MLWRFIKHATNNFVLLYCKGLFVEPLVATLNRGGQQVSPTGRNENFLSRKFKMRVAWCDAYTVFLSRWRNSFTTPPPLQYLSLFKTPTYTQLPAATLLCYLNFSSRIVVYFILSLNKYIRTSKARAISHCWSACVNPRIQENSTNHNTFQSSVETLCYWFIHTCICVSQ
jgi:hypothetical protein